jgi:hypothetical protein
LISQSQDLSVNAPSNYNVDPKLDPTNAIIVRNQLYIAYALNSASHSIRLVWRELRVPADNNDWASTT